MRATPAGYVYLSIVELLRCRRSFDKARGLGAGTLRCVPFREGNTSENLVLSIGSLLVESAADVLKFPNERRVAEEFLVLLIFRGCVFQPGPHRDRNFSQGNRYLAREVARSLRAPGIDDRHGEPETRAKPGFNKRAKISAEGVVDHLNHRGMNHVVPRVIEDQIGHFLRQLEAEKRLKDVTAGRLQANGIKLDKHDSKFPERPLCPRDEVFVQIHKHFHDHRNAFHERLVER
mmetsp:Transcript_28391/g.71251  ORF Transcript_28391/g.71251 Transcript_28391/m.71251 type:complete len:233 (+) Transcript_28391:60-758(+)